MTSRHWARLEELAACTFGGELDDETRREVDWRGYLSRAPAGWTLSRLGRRELRRYRELRADLRNQARATRQE